MDDDVETYGIDMPDMDARFGTCGAMGADGKRCDSRTVVARVAIPTLELDYNDPPSERPVYLGEEVMVEVCRKHHDSAISQVLVLRKEEADRQYARIEATERLRKAEAEVEAAQAALRRI
jgi:hypothetical protein